MSGEGAGGRKNKNSKTGQKESKQGSGGGDGPLQPRKKRAGRKKDGLKGKRRGESLNCTCTGETAGRDAKKYGQKQKKETEKTARAYQERKKKLGRSGGPLKNCSTITHRGFIRVNLPRG